MTEQDPEYKAPAELMSLLSEAAIPFTGFRTFGSRKWFGGDNELRYRKAGHPKFGPDDIDYSLNRHGYRCIEFDQREKFSANDLHLLVIGESHAFGIGMPENLTYAYLVAQKLAQHTGCKVQHWNLSQGGAGAEYIARVLPSALAVLRPDFVVLNFPPGRQRREYLFDDGNYLSCGEGEHVAGSVYTESRHTKVKRMHFEHAHRDADRFNLWKSIAVCQRHLLTHGAMWIFKANRDVPDIFRPYIDFSKLTNRRIVGLVKEKYKHDEALRFARDGRHAGIGPHSDIAEDLFQLFFENYSSELNERFIDGNSLSVGAS